MNKTRASLLLKDSTNPYELTRGEKFSFHQQGVRGFCQDHFKHGVCTYYAELQSVCDNLFRGNWKAEKKLGPGLD